MLRRPCFIAPGPAMPDNAPENFFRFEALLMIASQTGTPSDYDDGEFSRTRGNADSIGIPKYGNPKTLAHIAYFEKALRIKGPVPHVLAKLYDAVLSGVPKSKLPAYLRVKLFGEDGDPAHVLAFLIYYRL